MRLSLACCVLLCAISSAIAAEDDNALREKIDAAIVKGADALWKLQAEDGGWHSVTYGHLKPGVATTAFVLETLSLIDKDRHAADFERAEKFLIAAQGKDGGLGTKGEWLEYPTYSTALGIMAFARLKPEGWETTIEPWVKYLISTQHENGGWSPEGTATNLNISATRYALSALDEADKLGPTTRLHASGFLDSCHNEDGGFIFSKSVPRLNKAGEANGKFLSYGSATFDGLIAYDICIGNFARFGIITTREYKFLDIQPDPIKKINTWIENQKDLEKCPGFGEADRDGWEKSITYYYLDALSSSFCIKPQFKPKNADLPKRVVTIALEAQNPDGLWQNKSNLMKEDDPLIASPLALKTLWNCKTALEPKK